MDSKLLLNSKLLTALMKELAPVVREYVNDAVRPLQQRVDLIEERGVVYRGTWQAPEQYNRGCIVTCDGSMWHANCSTRDKPGVNSAWTLCVKKGKDAPDSKGR